MFKQVCCLLFVLGEFVIDEVEFVCGLSKASMLLLLSVVVDKVEFVLWFFVVW